MKLKKRRRAATIAALLPLAALLGGCDRRQSFLHPASHQSTDLAGLFWWTMGAAWIGLGLVVFLLIFSWRRANKRGIGKDTAGAKPGERFSVFVVVSLGVAVPLALMVLLFVIGDLLVIHTTEAPAANATKLTVQVVGHQWWWEFRYPGTTAVTADELHIPARTPVRIDVQSDDVIHSFYVPRLNRTIDAIPGRTNPIELYADAPGRYRGQCSEFCGLQHAHMAFYVYADPPAVFRRWLKNQERPAAAPKSAAARAGEQVFLSGPCSSCHQIRGTSADAHVGPDLTHLMSRSTIGGLVAPNRKGYLAGWILNSQSMKPGNDMPDINLSGPKLQDLLAYLEGLK